MKKIFETLTVNNLRAIVRYNPFNAEYVVRLYEVSVCFTTVLLAELPNASYYTDDRADAINTSIAMVEGRI